MADFIGDDLRGSRFEHIDLSGAEIRAGDLVDTRFRAVEMSGVVNTELDRRYPERAKMRPPTPPASVRRGMSTVREVIDGLTDESLDGRTEPVEGPGCPQSRSYPVRECLLCILNEEWEHRLYAERDLDILEARST